MRLNKLFACLTLALCAALGLSAQSVRVIFVTGQAQIQAPGETSLRPLAKGEVVTLGARIVTGADGRVALTPLPGVKALITPNTDLLLESASETAQADGTVSAAATLDLKQGAVVTDILKQDGVSYDYNVRTPRGLAGARGTNYTVGVNAAGIETVVVSEGSITFNLLDGRQLSLAAGQITVTDASGEVRQAASLDELSAADQAFAQEIAEATLEALESAIASGIEINPVAIDQALQVFQNFGLDVSDSTLQLLNRLRAALETLREAINEEDASTIVSEQREEDDGRGPVTGTPYQIFVAGLNSAQSLAFAEILDRGGFDASAELFQQRFSDSGFTTALRETINLYVSLSTPARDQAVTLGILGDANETAIGTDSAGLARLLESYATTTPAFVAQVDEAPFGSGTNNALVFTNIFFDGGSGDSGLPVYNISFGDAETDADLQVGATRSLNIENNANFQPDNATNFEVAEGRDIIVRAAETVGLTGAIETPITFSSASRGVLIEAITLNLANVNFTEGSVIVLTSRDGGVASAFDSGFKIPNFGSSVVGRVNFLGGVFYGDYLLDGDEAFVLGSRGNIRIAAFADGLNPAFPDYTPVDTRPTPEDIFLDGLDGDQLAIYNSLPSDVRQKLVDLNDADITGLLLSPDRETGVPFTATETERILDTYAALSPNAKNFVKTLAGGPGLPDLDNIPDIFQWSPAALDATAVTFNALDSTIQDALLAMGAGDAIIGLNTDYIQGLVVAASDQAAAIAQSGWGRYLDDLVTDDALSKIDEAASDATAAQRALIRLLDIDPYRLAEVLRNLYEGEALPLYDRLDFILANVSSSDLELAAQLGFDGSYAIFYSSDPVADIAAIVAHYDGLTPDQKIAARALRLGSLLIDPTRAANITDFYLGLDPAQREAMRDTDLVTAFFTGPGGQVIIPDGESGGESPLQPVVINDTLIQFTIVTAIDAYLALDPKFQNYLLNEAGAFDLLDILNSNVGQTDDNGRNLRSLTEIVSILDDIAADPADFRTLLDLDLGRAVLFAGYLDTTAPTPADAVRDAIGFFRALTPAEQSTIRELGIVGANHVGFVGSDYTGVSRLLKAYAALPTAARVDTLRISEDSVSPGLYDERVSYFLPYDKDYVLENIRFSSPSDLLVGAVRRLRIDNSSLTNPGPDTTFVVEGNRTANIHLRAGDLIDLNNTPIASNARGITMEAITINLANVHFPEGTTAALTSRDGGLYFGSSTVGGVNFLSNVTYGGFLLDSQPNFDANSRGNIAIGSFAAPAALPDYTQPDSF
jgi:hypothetical protein